MPDIQVKIGYLQDDVTKEIFLPKTDSSLVTGLEDLATIRQKSNSAYQKPQSGIPASDMANGVIPDVSNLAQSLTASSKKIWAGTAAEYALLTPSDDTIYFIKP